MVWLNYAERAVETDRPGHEESATGVDNKASEIDEDCSSSEASSTVEEEEEEEGEDDDLTTDSAANTKSLATLNNNDLANFGNIAVNNSTDIHIGNKTFYHGPVTIRQFVYGKDGVEGEIGLELVTTEDAAAKNLGRTYPPPGEGIYTTKCIQESEHGLPEKPHFFTSLASARHRCTIWIVTLSVAVTVTLATLLVVNANRHAAVNPATSNPYAGEGTFNQPNTKYNVTLSGKLRMLNRTDWLAQPATAPLDLLARPAQLVVISHTATENCYSQAQCIYFVRNMQTFHIESKGWFDIGYNFLIGGDGYVYVGRGWDTMGAHTYGYNVCSIGISFIGTYLTTQPTDGQILAAELLIEQGVLLGKLIPDYQLVGHRQVSATESPGQALFDILKKLPHWTKIPDKCVKKSQ